jgi:hypothetical protein
MRLVAVKTIVPSVGTHTLPDRALSVKYTTVPDDISTRFTKAKRLFVEAAFGHHAVENHASVFTVVMTRSQGARDVA